MTSIRKLLFFITATTLALSSGAAFGGDKEYTLVMSPTTGASPIATMTATFTNKGSSTFNSLTLTVPGGYSLTGSPSASSNRGNLSYDAGTGVVTVTDIGYPVGSGNSQAITITLNGVVVTSAICSGLPGNWTAVVYTGSSTNGQKFAQAAPSTTTTSISPTCYTVTPSPGANGSMSPSTPQQVSAGFTKAFTVTPDAGYYISSTGGTCGGSLTGNTYTTAAVGANCNVTATFARKTLSIASPPTSAAVGDPFAVKVDVTPGGPVPSMTSGCGATETHTSTATSTTFTVTIPTLPASGMCTITFSSGDYQPVSLTNLKVYKGVLFCGDYDSVNGPGDPSYDPDAPSTVSGLGSSYVGTPGWGLRRGPNKDGSTCIKINYSCDLDTTTSPAVATCIWDKASLQLATFKYLFLWPPKAPDANGWTSYRPQVSWPPAVPDNTYTFPNWAPLVACISDTFPTLPTLPTTILPLIPAQPPFSTDPMNTLAQYQPGATAFVCGGQSGWTAVGSPGNPLLQWWIVVVDEADVKVVGP